MSGQAASSASVGGNVVEDAVAAARKAIADLLDRERDLRPHCIRIAFYDAITYNPIAKVDGPNGSIRLWEGLAQDEGMKKTIEKLDNLKATGYTNVWSYISYADLYQLAGLEAVKKAGGPPIEFQHGRTVSSIPIQSKLPIIDEDSKADFVKATFHRIGFTNKEIVALSSAYYYWMNYTPLEQNFNTSYYEKLLKEIVVPKPQTSNTNLRYWKCLLSDASFLKYVELFAKDANAFAKEYASAHKKLSELGFKHFPEPLLSEAEHHDIKHGVVFAVAMTIIVGFVGFFYEVMRG